MPEKSSSKPKSNIKLQILWKNYVFNFTLWGFGLLRCAAKWPVELQTMAAAIAIEIIMCSF